VITLLLKVSFQAETEGDLADGGGPLICGDLPCLDVIFPLQAVDCSIKSVRPWTWTKSIQPLRYTYQLHSSQHNSAQYNHL